MSAADPRVLQARLAEVAAPDLDLAFRAMFGGIMAYADTKPFASLSDIGLALKFAGADHAAFAALGAVPLRYEPDAPPSKSYGVVRAAILADDAALAHWVGRSAAAVKPAVVRRKVQPLSTPPVAR